MICKEWSTRGRYAAWTTAGIMLHYERLLEESCQEPLRWELRRAGCAMSKAIKAYASADFRARREQHNLVVRQRFDQLAKECLSARRAHKVRGVEARRRLRKRRLRSACGTSPDHRCMCLYSL